MPASPCWALIRGHALFRACRAHAAAGKAATALLRREGQARACPVPRAVRELRCAGARRRGLHGPVRDGPRPNRM